MSNGKFWVIQVEIFAGLIGVAWALGLAGPASGRAREPIFTDDKGRVIYPYLQREVKNTVTANAKGLQNCFNQMLSRLPNSGNEGIVHLDWRISEAGKPSQFRVIFNSYHEAAFEECLVGEMGRWQFPPPPADLYAEHKFQFSRKVPLE